jgi:hypothetical protein
MNGFKKVVLLSKSGKLISASVLKGQLSEMEKLIESPGIPLG